MSPTSSCEQRQGRAVPVVLLALSIREVPMPFDPIARWESEGGSILPIERLRPTSKSDAPRHMADGSDASESNLDERRDILIICAVVALAGVALLLPARRSRRRDSIRAANAKRGKRY
jgi:hypothetical protein